MWARTGLYLSHGKVTQGGLGWGQELLFILYWRMEAGQGDSERARAEQTGKPKEVSEVKCV